MSEHELILSDLDFGDDLRLLVCHQCNRSLSVEATENGAFVWTTLKLINQGDFFALHWFSSPGLKMTVMESVK